MNTMTRTLRGAALGAALALATAVGAPAAQTPAPAPADAAVVLIESPSAVLRRSDYELELLRLPPDARASFPVSQKRIEDVVARLWNQ